MFIQGLSGHGGVEVSFVYSDTGLGSNGVHVMILCNHDTKKGNCIPLQLQIKGGNRITDTFSKNGDYYHHAILPCTAQTQYNIS